MCTLKTWKKFGKPDKQKQDGADYSLSWKIQEKVNKPKQEKSSSALKKLLTYYKQAEAV